jgi:hypothetical protein
MYEFIVPALRETRFTCPHCGALASIGWNSIYLDNPGEGDYRFHTNHAAPRTNWINVSTCHACFKPHLWLDDNMIYPNISNIPAPSIDMPEYVLSVYIEAKNVFPYSAKAAAALLRLAIQLLCKELGESGDNINADIASLVQKGLPVRVQQALDYIRVVGNNAVHPGTIDLDDDADMAGAMFVLINIIVNDMITQPKSIQALYSQLPQGALNAIQRRDGNNT